MAFIGVFILVIIGWVLLIMAIAILIPCLVIFIINLVKGIQNHWPKRNIVGVAITGTVLGLFTLLLIYFIIQNSLPRVDNTVSSSARAIIDYIATRF